MSLEGSHWIWGYFYDEDGNPISGADITASNVTGSETETETTTTTATGYYQINVQDICDEGDLIEIQFQDGADIHKIADEFIRVNLDDLTQEVNATFESQFEVNTDTFSFYLPMPEWDRVNSKLNKNIRLFNFKSGDISVIDIDIAGEPYVIEGYFYVDVYTKDTISGKVEAIIHMQNNSEEITIWARDNEFDGINDNVNFIFVIRNFTFESIKNVPNLFAYKLELEYVDSFDTSEAGGDSPF